MTPEDEKSNGQLTTILDCLAEGVFTVDPHRNIRFFNKGAEAITGFSAKEAIGRQCRDIFRTSLCNQQCTIREVEQTGNNITNRVVRILTRDGRSILVSISAAALRDEDGDIIGGVETFRDLSTEEDLRRKIQRSYSFHDIVSRHPKMHELFAILPDIAESNVSVLIEGESGTGKELLARAIHALSDRKDRPFIPVNCGSLPDTLLESELFGYRKGAFTDATRDKPGRFDAAQGGTLLLDEIGDISSALQVRLLRVLQEKTYEPLGATEAVQSTARVLAATNRHLSDEVKAGNFREDLYYRLNVLRLELPPLRERRCDIPILLDHFRRRLNAETGKHIEAFDDSVVDLCMRHEFPGNAREMENLVHHAFVLCKDPVIKVEHLPLDFVRITSHTSDTHPLSLEALEKHAIGEALQSNGDNRLATARQLGMTRALFIVK